jgi:hypothetical protein
MNNAFTSSEPFIGHKANAYCLLVCIPNRSDGRSRMGSFWYVAIGINWLCLLALAVAK